MPQPRKRLVLFVCTGNVCRSPMAEYLLRHYLRGENAWRVESAGLYAVPGQPASPAAIEVLRERGMDLSPHRSRQLKKELIDAADLIVVMTHAHAADVARRFPDAAARVRLLTDFSPAFSGRDIADPIGCTADVYRAIRDEIEAALLDLVLFLTRKHK